MVNYILTGIRVVLIAVNVHLSQIRKALFHILRLITARHVSRLAPKALN